MSKLAQIYINQWSIHKTTIHVFCLPKEWHSDVPYNIRYTGFMVQPLGGFWYIYVNTSLKTN